VKSDETTIEALRVSPRASMQLSDIYAVCAAVSPSQAVRAAVSRVRTITSRILVRCGPSALPCRGQWEVGHERAVRRRRKLCRGWIRRDWRRSVHRCSACSCSSSSSVGVHPPVDAQRHHIETGGQEYNRLENANVVLTMLISRSFQKMEGE
jgi:hypothetical protein